jgi:nitroreductase
MHQPLERSLSALDVIFTRRSVRAYTPAKIEPSTIRALLDAAVHAPTALHAEPLAFVIIQDRSLLARYSDRAKGTWAQDAATHRGDLHGAGDPEMTKAFATRFASPDFNIFYDAGTLVIICAKPLGPFVAADAWLAAENLMLAACALGLSSCCIGSAVPLLNSPDVKAELGIPREIEVIAPIVLGVPAKNAMPTVQRRDPQILAWK